MSVWFDASTEDLERPADEFNRLYAEGGPSEWANLIGALLYRTRAVDQSTFEAPDCASVTD